MEKEQGSALIEAIVALAAIVVAVAAVAILMVSSVSNSEFIKNQNQANKYAQEGMEYLRSKKDENFDNFLSNYKEDHSYCLTEDFRKGNRETDSKCQGERLGSDPNKQFIRTVEIKPGTIANGCGDGESYHVTVTVHWQSGKCDVNTKPFCHESRLVSCFIDKPQIAP